MLGQKFVAIFEANGCSAVLRIGVSQVRICCGSAMAIPAFELNVGTVRSAANRLHVNGVIQFDCSGITRGCAPERAQCGEFRVAVLEADNMILVLGVGTLSLEIAMAPCARLIACGPKIDATAMLCVTGNAIGRSFGRRVVRRSVMAGEARVISYLRGKRDRKSTRLN